MLHIDVSTVKSDCSAFLQVAHTVWLMWLVTRTIFKIILTYRTGHYRVAGNWMRATKEHRHLPSNKQNLAGATNYLTPLPQPLKSPSSALGASQELPSDALPQWEQTPENDHQLITKALEQPKVTPLWPSAAPRHNCGYSL